MKQLILIMVIAFASASVNAEVIYYKKGKSLSQQSISVCYRDGKRTTFCYSPNRQYTTHTMMIPINNRRSLTLHNTPQYNVNSSYNTYDHSHHKLDKILDTALKIAVLKKILDD